MEHRLTRAAANPREDVLQATVDRVEDLDGRVTIGAILGKQPPAADGLSPTVVLNRIHDRAAELVDQQYRCWNETLRPALMDAVVEPLAAAQAERIRQQELVKEREAHARRDDELDHGL